MCHCNLQATYTNITNILIILRWSLKYMHDSTIFLIVNALFVGAKMFRLYLIQSQDKGKARTENFIISFLKFLTSKNMWFCMSYSCSINICFKCCLFILHNVVHGGDFLKNVKYCISSIKAEVCYPQAFVHPFLIN